MNDENATYTIEIASNGVIYSPCKCIKWLENPTRLEFIYKGKIVVTNAQVIVEEDYRL